jgi:hypothetical protein
MLPNPSGLAVMLPPDMTVLAARAFVVGYHQSRGFGSDKGRNGGNRGFHSHWLFLVFALRRPSADLDTAHPEEAQSTQTRCIPSAREEKRC